jgi:SAM-dependent methyltransferase
LSAPDFTLGCRLPLEDWLWLNRTGAFERPELLGFVSPSPPPELMRNVSGLESASDFASHGADIYRALSAASPRPLTEYRHILDFGCGCGRLARMFKGHPHKVSGCDIDPRHVEWARANLGHMRVLLSAVNPPLPFENGEFDAIISISVFTHLNETTQDAFLADLNRISAPGGMLFLTVHGEQALARAVAEPQIRAIIDVPDQPFEQARDRFARGDHAFILQQGHLTTVNAESEAPKVIDAPYEYGISFTPEEYVRRHWGQWFDVMEIRSGAIHSFQDIVVLRARK